MFLLLCRFIISPFPGENNEVFVNLFIIIISTKIIIIITITKRLICCKQISIKLGWK